MVSKPELSEKNFIHEGYKKNPFPLWIWFFLLTVLMALFWGGSHWYSGRLNTLFRNSPFLQVTNRELSLFLWENPEFMRVNAKQKSGYLPGFQYIDKITMEVANADEYAAAPPELLFRYHTWQRLVSKEFIARNIPTKEFRNFLSYAEEWLPAYWPQATKEYKELVETLGSTKIEDLSKLSMSQMPLQVRMAFQGWRNYFSEGEAIDKVKPTVAQIKQFLSSYPHYARNYWRNIVEDSNPNYLVSISKPEEKNAEAVIPSDEMAPFLKVAIYNYLVVFAAKETKS